MANRIFNGLLLIATHSLLHQSEANRGRLRHRPGQPLLATRREQTATLLKAPCQARAVLQERGLTKSRGHHQPKNGSDSDAKFAHCSPLSTNEPTCLFRCPPQSCDSCRSVPMRERSSTLRYCLISVPEWYLFNNIYSNYICELHIVQS